MMDALPCHAIFFVAFFLKDISLQDKALSPRTLDAYEMFQGDAKRRFLCNIFLHLSCG